MSTGRRPPDERRRPPAQRPRAAAGGNRSSRGDEEAEARPRSDLLARVVVAVPAAVVAVVLINIGGTAWMVFMAIMACLALQELYTMLGRWKPVPLVGYVGVVAMCVAARYGHVADNGNLRDVFGLAALTIPLVFLGIATRAQEGGETLSIASTLLGVFWIGVAFSHAVMLRQLSDGQGILIDVAVATFLGDTGAYFGGRYLGRRLLAPTISPKKTVEGLVCGMAVAVLAVYFASLYQTDYLTGGKIFGLGIAIAVLGPLGDLFESMIKRDAGTKDAGNLFGAHGGALDRLDGVMFTVVAAYYIWAAVGPPLH